MSSSGADAVATEPPVRRVREEVKDGLAVAATSALASTFAVLVVLVLMKLAG